MSRPKVARNRARDMKQGRPVVNYYPGAAKSSLAQAMWHEGVGIARKYLNAEGTMIDTYKAMLLGAAALIATREQFFNEFDGRGMSEIANALVRDCRTVDMYPDEYEGVGETR